MFSLFTDASSNYMESGYSVLAGVILNPKNEPVAEFATRSRHSNNHEGLAIKHGIDLARQMSIPKLRCFTDSLTHAKVNPVYLTPHFKEFESLTVNYIPRRFNQYANALSRVLVNVECRQGGDVKKAYHGVNRAKGSFYKRLHDLLENEKKYDHDWEYKRASSKFHSIMKELELASKGLKQIDFVKMRTLVEQLYALFQEYRFDEVSSLDTVLNNKNIRCA